VTQSFKINQFQKDLSGECLAGEWVEEFADYSPDKHSSDIWIFRAREKEPLPAGHPEKRR
jgi:hypothetical protein